MKLCTEPWSTIVVANNGDVNPCICPEWNTVGVIGNLLQQSLPEVLLSKKLQNFKQKILREDYSLCAEACGFKDHVTDKNKDVLDDLKYPKKIMLAIDKNCNLACSSCRTHNIFSPYPNKNAVKILEEIYEFYKDKPVEIQFDGLGDLFASRAYTDFLQKDFGENFKFHIITNGNLLTKNSKIIEKIKNNIISIDVSLDAGTPETYKIIRGGVFELVKDGIKMCVELGIRTNLSFVVQAKNYKEIKKFWDIGVQLKCGQAMLHMIRRWDHMSNQYWQENSTEHLPKEERNILWEQLQFLKGQGEVFTENSIPVRMTGDLYNFKP